ncbi:hypothetical protein I5V32_11555 [Stenotrophomonas maltophilia]|uniref:Uncharacterized protein n=1 Tax=Stenotrophomonas maltophilia TaxID=40324 RepID=A0AA40YDD6_STEMA|nr:MULTISPECIES: hypothetical protein [Stenotrophomonas]AWB76706.1 hypothetical protein B7H26_01515 [Stenotrophomonas maltophilia]KOO85464.1 hypothetical protein VL21_03660 [Stenotrophomonas maltophilia]MBH1584151.1 hypothetical protein [Stenotrophomonas maltophilia]MBH1716765.1 hypothetical protein [Stenotrophomonas maltophilia]MBH1789750.1 hypothetical protein [Stenotrophomonas maltophilia]
MTRKIIDLDTVQPNGKRGETQRPAFTKINDNFAEIYAGLDDAQSALMHLEGRMAGRNPLINGDFRFWQRGAAFPASTGSRYIADRWAVNAIGTKVAASREDVPPGGGQGGRLLAGSRHLLRLEVQSVAGAGNMALVQQRIEDVRTLAGRTVTISFKARASVDDFRIGVELQQSYGTSGSTARDSIGASVVLDTLWRWYQVTVEVPGLAGKALGPDSYLQLSFWLDAGADFGGRAFAAGQKSGSVQLAEVQIEEGDTATDFDRRSEALELLLCQRYYETVDVNRIIGITYTANGDTRACIPFKVRKRSAPRISSPSTALNLVGFGNAGNLVNFDGGAPSWQSTVDAAVIASMPNNMQLWGAVVVWSTTSQVLVQADAEL